MCVGRVFHATDALKKKEVVCLCDSAGATSLHLGFSQANCSYEAPPLGRERKRSVSICNGLQ